MLIRITDQLLLVVLPENKDAVSSDTCYRFYGDALYFSVRPATAIRILMRMAE